MAGTNFKTENNTFRKLLGNGLTYRIPRFQRDYSWTDTEWEELWADIVETDQQGGDAAHYMGYLVLQSDNEKTFDVIDGQQRLTTLSIIVLAILRNLNKLVATDDHKADNQRRMDQIRSSYIGYLDPVTLIGRSKLTLNRNNDAYYQRYLVPLEALPQRGFKASEHAMRKASDWFERRIADYANLAEHQANKGVSLAQLLENMSDRLFFTVITVSDELNAYKVFETLNARGVRLSATDLLKNYLFSVLHKGGVPENEMTAMDDRWEALVSRLGESDLPDFLRVHWMSRHGLVRQPDLFKTIRARIENRDHVFALLSALDADVDPYLGLTAPDSSNWPPEIRSEAALLRMFSVRQPYALLIAAKRVLDQSDFTKLLRYIVIISMRYNVIGTMQAGEQERAYSNLAVRISRGEASSLADIIEGLRNVYPSDAAFKAAFADKELKTTQSRNNRIVRYILGKLELHDANNAVDVEAAGISIEHILPQNPDAGWEHFNEMDGDAFTFRLGNMTLLESGPNRELGNRGFLAKRDSYAASQLAITRAIAADSDEWTTQRIIERQRQMAKAATGIWRIDQLS